MRIIWTILLLFLGGGIAASAQTGMAQTEPDPGSKRIALTYDDAPRGDGRLFTGADRTEALLDQWDKAGTGPVAIFATTRGLDRDGRARLQAYGQAGHRIANHTDTHPWASRTSVGEFIADTDRAETLLEGLPNRRPWFRFPYLDEGGYGEDRIAARAKREALRQALSERGLRNGYVTVDTYDWHLDSLLQQALKDGRAVDEDALGRVYADMVVDAAAHYDRMAMDVLGARPAQVLLLHENDIAALATHRMVAALRRAGWTIIDPDEAYADPALQAAPDTLFSGMGRLAAIARESGRAGADDFDHWSADEAGIEARVAAEKAFGEQGRDAAP
ncbi:polysaccharide deacetylase family protein [uncultured Algimonas sp.]|uniref:polysaccharide deacetylase family protein n=1 Tax=uncultured Algimonas sp. TaxID=1547920 RepID=UPI002630EA2B|nr:polysaccharide deacetylase family protein [uncultured Algimonas sp.]